MRALEWSVEHEGGAECDEGKPDHLIERQRLAEIGGGEDRKHAERDDLLDRLELGAGKDVAAVTVGRNRQEYSGSAIIQLATTTSQSGFSR